MRKSYVRSVLAAAVVLLVLVAGGTDIEAQQRGERLVVVMIDDQSIAADQASSALVKSLLGLLYHLKEGQLFTFVFIDDPTSVYGPMETNASEFLDLKAQIEAQIAPLDESPAEPTSLDLVPALSELYNYLTGINAGPDTTIHLITANRASADADAELHRLDPVIQLIRGAGWSVFNYTTPETDPGLLTMLSSIGDETRGESFDLTVPDGFERLTNQNLKFNTKGAMTSMGGIEFSPDSVFEVDVDIVPGTGELNMLFFRENPVTPFRLENPDGFEDEAGDRTSSSIIELPHVVIWELTDPIPGSWKLEVRGNSGMFTAHRFSTNRFSIELQTYGAIPVGIPMTLVAAVMDGNQRVPVDGIMTATVSDPSGTTIQYELTDQGVDGDSIAEDGLFSATIPLIGSEGSYDVELQLSWPGIDHSIITQSSFEAREFPTVTITPEEIGIINPGTRSKIATAHVSIGGQPFSVSTDELSAAVATNQGNAGPLELVVQHFITADRAASFDIFYTPESESLATVLVNLNVEYAGRPFQTTSDSIVVSSVQPVPTAVPQIVALAPTPAPTPRPPEPEPPAAEAQVPMGLIVALAVLGVIILVLVGYWLSRPTPFGYLYTEDGELVLDFGAIERSSIDNLLNRNRVSGGDLELAGFENVSFVFGSGEMSIRTTQISSAMTVRVNNQPVTDSIIVHENSWIGAQGRLYTFLTEHQGS